LNMHFTNLVKSWYCHECAGLNQSLLYIEYDLNVSSPSPKVHVLAAWCPVWLFEVVEPLSGGS
jgi:hypothetical protein